DRSTLQSGRSLHARTTVDAREHSTGGRRAAIAGHAGAAGNNSRRLDLAHHLRIRSWLNRTPTRWGRVGGPDPPSPSNNFGALCEGDCVSLWRPCRSRSIYYVALAPTWHKIVGES